MSIYVKQSNSVNPLNYEGNSIAKTCLLTYRSATLLAGTVSDIPSKYNGGIACVSIFRIPRTPYDAISALTISEISNGSLSVYAKGAGFVSGHVLQTGILVAC